MRPTWMALIALTIAFGMIAWRSHASLSSPAELASALFAAVLFWFVRDFLSELFARHHCTHRVAAVLMALFIILGVVAAMGIERLCNTVGISSRLGVAIGYSVSMAIALASITIFTGGNCANESLIKASLANSMRTPRV